MENLEYYLSIAEKAARKAGAWLVKGYASFDPMFSKNKHEYYISADVECGKIYADFLKKETPEISIVSEEKGGKISDLCWVVDPIDGTSNYRVGVPYFTTQVCLLKDGEPMVSVIYNPIIGQEFSAKKGNGSFLNGKNLACSDVEKIKEALLIVAKGGNNKIAGGIISQFGDLVRTVRLYGATSIDLAYLAAGKFDISINCGSKLHDYAPGVLLIREAGGIVSNLKGSQWTIDDNNLVAANKFLMPKVLEIIKQMPL